MCCLSGLIEIAYDTGTTVIIQGPAAYQVDSRIAVFLLCGRLVARTCKRMPIRPTTRRTEGEVPGEAESAEWQIAPCASLVAHTPSVFHPSHAFDIISNEDAEFGVQVDKSGASQSYVFGGYVELRFAGGEVAGVQCSR